MFNANVLDLLTEISLWIVFILSMISMKVSLCDPYMWKFQMTVVFRHLVTLSKLGWAITFCREDERQGKRSLGTIVSECQKPCPVWLYQGPKFSENQRTDSCKLACKNITWFIRFGCICMLISASESANSCKGPLGDPIAGSCNGLQIWGP